MVKATKLPPMVGVLLGISFYELSDTVLYLVQPLFFPTLLRLIGLFVVVFFLSKASFDKIQGPIKPLFNFLVLWSIIIVLRGSLIGNVLPGGSLSLSYILRRLFLDSFGALSFFVPLLALMKARLSGLYYIKKMGLFFCVGALVMIYMSRDQIAYGQLTNGMTTILNVDGDYISVRNLIHAAFPGFGVILFMLFCSNYINGFRVLLFPVAIFVFFLVMAIGGGRGDTIFNLIYLIMFFYLIVSYPKMGNRKNKVDKVVGKIFALLFGIFFLIFLVYLYSKTEIFDYVLDRAFGSKELSIYIEDSSRDILVRDMTKDFNAHPLDWLWGRGVNGSYATQHLGINGRRAWMEWGFRYLILKGGIIYLVLVVVCWSHAFVMGFLKSRNIFSKSLACMCLAALIGLLSTNSEPQYTTFFVMSWICFGLLEKNEIRMMSDEDIYGYFNVKNYNRKGL